MLKAMLKTTLNHEVGWGEVRTPTVAVFIQPRRVGVRKLTPTYNAKGNQKSS